jgi:hypothetical protein
MKKKENFLYNLETVEVLGATKNSLLWLLKYWNLQKDFKVLIEIKETKKKLIINLRDLNLKVL